jgi:segregation and condensation protein A
VTAAYQIDLPAYAGPLDLLLHLIERNELDITAISLAKVSEQYLAQVESLKGERMEQLIDFLVVGARLALIKSRALLPRPAVTAATGEEEEDPGEALARQLRHYKRFKEAAGWLARREDEGLRTYLRVAPPPKIESRLDLSGVDVATLQRAMLGVLERVKAQEESLAVVERPAFTIEGQIERLRRQVRVGRRVIFGELLSARPTPAELSVTLLALLELVKRREIEARQPFLFGPIEIAPAAPGDASEEAPEL